MENNPKKNGHTTGIRELRRLVKNIYPSARLWSTDMFQTRYKKEFPQTEYLIFRFDEKAGDSGRFTIISNKCGSEIEAWHSAMEKIKSSMISKLEN